MVLLWSVIQTAHISIQFTVTKAQLWKITVVEIHTVLCLYFDCTQVSSIQIHSDILTYTHKLEPTHTWPWWFVFSVTYVLRTAKLMKKVFYWSVNQYSSPPGLYSRGQQKVWVDSLTLCYTASQPACVTFISAASVICPWMIWQSNF